MLSSTVNGILATATIPRVSASFPLQDGVNDTRTGAIGTAATNIFAAWNHQHPISKIATIPTIGNIAITGLGTFVSQTVTSNSTEETISYNVFVTWTTNGIGSWATFIIPTITGYTLTESRANTYDVTGSSLNLTRMLNGVTNYSTPNTYYAQTAVTGRTIYSTFQLTYTLN